MNPFSMIQVGRAALSPGKPRGKRPSTRASIGSRRGSTHRIFHSGTGEFVGAHCVRIAAKSGKTFFRLQRLHRLFRGGFVSPPSLPLMKEKKVKENQGAKGSANLALIRIRVSGKKIFRLDGGITVKAKMKIPRCDSSGHIGVTIDHCPQDQKLF